MGLTAEQARDIAQFTAGYTLAMQHGVQDLEQRVLQASAERALADLEPTIVARAEAAGHTHIRTLLELRQKQAEFEKKRETAPTETDRHRYAHYLECLSWVIQTTEAATNGH